MTDTPITPSTWSRRHSWYAALVGGLVGFLLGGVVFLALVLLTPVVDIEARGEGKGGAIIEVFWVLLGIPLSMIVGALWPATIGRCLNPKRKARPADLQH